LPAPRRRTIPSGGDTATTSTVSPSRQFAVLLWRARDARNTVDLVAFLQPSSTYRVRVFEAEIQGLTIEVRDLERSKQFYEEVLGFTPGEFYEPTRWQPYNFGDQFFGIREILNSDRRSREDILNFACADVETLWRRVREKTEVIEPLAATPWGSYKFVIADPDGFRIGFVQKR